MIILKKPQQYKAIFVLLFISFITMSSLMAQTPIGIGTRYSNSFREWIITTDDEDVEGELRMRWTFQDDWTSWDFELGDAHGTIDQKWEGEPDLWEIKCNGVIVNARTAWKGEFYRWKLSDGTHQFNWQPKFRTSPDEWETEDNKEGFLQMYTYYDGDAREWVIKDELPKDVSVAMRMALIFLALHFSTPRI
jgi:hypothetical protein